MFLIKKALRSEEQNSNLEKKDKSQDNILTNNKIIKYWKVYFSKASINSITQTWEITINKTKLIKTGFKSRFETLQGRQQYFTIPAIVSV